MKSTSILALGVALALGGLSAAAPAYAAQEKSEAAPERKYKFSKEAQPKLAELQKALNAGDEAAYQAALAAAKAAAQNNDDRYVIGQMQLSHAIKANDDAQKLAAIQALIQSGGATEAELPALYQNLGALQFNAEQYGEAAASFKKQLELQPNNKEAMNNLAAALAQQDPGQAATVLAQQIEAAKAANQPVPEETYKQALGLAYEAQSPQAIELSRELVAAYPTAENWRTALTLYRESKNPTGDVNLDLLRLMRVTDSLNSERNYFELADAANNKGLPGEAKAVLDAGIAAKAVDPNKPVFKELLANASGKVEEDRGSLPALEKKAMASSTGTLAVSTGDAYYGYGDYAKAAALYRAALEKGSVDANLVNTRLGMALAQAGQKAEAEAAFKAVTGPRAELTSYWLIWLNQSA
jgi:tetratricopeptide (TPR) repeat protein